jgi:hypothetical protein
MAITIKELLAADSVSQIVDKINFNFDQIMLNGGGPPGGPGNPGGPGIPGPKGEKGTVWYYGDTDPNSLTFSDVKGDDYYLQSTTDSTGEEGDVWIYNDVSLAWTNTGINLTGPAGTASAAIFDTAGASIITGTNVLDGLDFSYLLPDYDLDSFLSTDIKSLLLGGYPLNAEGADPTNPNVITGFVNSINSTNGILFINSPNTAPQIVLSSTNEPTATDDVSEMSTIESDIYDVLRIKNKRRTDTDAKTLTGTDFSGIYLNTLDSDIDLISARDVTIIAQGAPLTTTSSGTLPTTSGNVTIGAIDGTGAAYTNPSILTLSKSNNSGTVTGLLRMGPSGTNGAKVDLYSIDDIWISGENISNIAQDEISFSSITNTYKFVNLPNISLTLDGLVVHNSTGEIGSINFAVGFTNGVLSWDGTEVQGSTGTDLSITRWDGATEIEDSLWFIGDTGNMYPSATTQTLGTAANRIGTLYLNSVIDYSTNLEFNNSSTTNVLFQTDGKVGIGVDSGLQSTLNIDRSLRFYDVTSFIIGAEQGANSGDRSVLRISGGAGSSGASDFHEGGDIYILGGDGDASNNGDGGSVYINGGAEGGSGDTGNIILGLDTTGTYSDSKIGILNYTPTYDLDVLSRQGDFAARLHTNVSGTNTKGGLTIQNNSGSEINFYPELAAASMNPIVEANDAAIIWKNQSGFGTLSGLVLGTDTSGTAIRIGGVGGDIELKADGSIKLNPNTLASPGNNLYIGNNGQLPTDTSSGGADYLLIIDPSGSVGSSTLGRVKMMSPVEVRTHIGAKSFVIQHPDKDNNYLVHACIEGPESAVYYRGDSETVNGEVEIILPEYFESLTIEENRTVQLTLIDDYTDELIVLKSTKVENGKFKVKSVSFKGKVNAKFYWEVKAVRKDITKLVVEPSKDDYILKGDGPYTYLINK